METLGSDDRDGDDIRAGDPMPLGARPFELNCSAPRFGKQFLPDQDQPLRQGGLGRSFGDGDILCEDFWQAGAA